MPDRGGEHARPDIRDVGELEQALHGAVLAVGSVQDRKDHVQRESRTATEAGVVRSMRISVSAPGCATQMRLVRRARRFPRDRR